MYEQYVQAEFMEHTYHHSKLLWFTEIIVFALQLG